MISFKQYISEALSARNWEEYHKLHDTEFVKPKIKLKKLPTKNVTKADLVYGMMVQATLDGYKYADLTLMPGVTRAANAWFKKRQKMHVAYAKENDMSTAHDALSVANYASALSSKGRVMQGYGGKQMTIGGKDYILDKPEWKSSRQKKDYDAWRAEQEKIYPEQFR
jgi:hypothetical protein